MSWNVNSIGKDDFQRVRLLEAHNSIFNYGLISICETSLNDSIKLPDILLTTNTRHCGVGLFYKNSLPIKISNDLSFNVSIVIEFNVLFSKFTNLYSKIKNENPYASFLTGDFNGHSVLVARWRVGKLKIL